MDLGYLSAMAISDAVLVYSLEFGSVILMNIYDTVIEVMQLRVNDHRGIKK